MFIAILFILFITFLLGWYTGQSVQDEIVPSRKYLEFGIDVLLLLMIALALFNYGQRTLAIVVVLALIVCRRFFSFSYAYAPISGVVLGAATLLAADMQIIILTLCLLMNFLLGATAKQKLLLKVGVMQPIVAFVLFALL